MTPAQFEVVVNQFHAIEIFLFCILLILCVTAIFKE